MKKSATERMAHSEVADQEEMQVYPMDEEEEKLNLSNSIPFFLLHTACLLVFWAGFSWTAVGVFALTYFGRMFGITGGFHRYFAHRTYKTSRVFQFIMGFIGSASAQMGPLWWAAHHRHHHRYSDQPEDFHSPKERGFWWAHIGWILCPKYDKTNWKNIRDFAKYPELRWLDYYHIVAPVSLAVGLFYLGVLVNYLFPQLGTSGLQFLVWGFFISTVVLYHCTFSINTLCHMIGTQRFKTDDDSRNSLILALITMGEGWHNNHHRYPGSERQGFYWWEIDLTHYILRILSCFGIVWDLRRPPETIYEEASQEWETKRLQVEEAKTS